MSKTFRKEKTDRKIRIIRKGCQDRFNATQYYGRIDLSETNVEPVKILVDKTALP